MLLSRNRIFSRNAPTRDAQKVFLFCDAHSREPDYFQYFQEIDARIDLRIFKPAPGSAISPKALLEWSVLVIEKEVQRGTFDADVDQVWIICDTDPDKRNSRGAQIAAIVSFCETKQEYHYGFSNPCFDVWLYYHFFTENPAGTYYDSCAEWKAILDSRQNFDSKTHPIFLRDAVFNAERNFIEEDGIPDSGSTGVFLLGKKLLDFVGEKLDTQRRVLNI